MLEIFAFEHHLLSLHVVALLRRLFLFIDRNGSRVFVTVQTGVAFKALRILLRHQTLSLLLLHDLDCKLICGERRVLNWILSKGLIRNFLLFNQ